MERDEFRETGILRDKGLELGLVQRLEGRETGFFREELSFYLSIEGADERRDKIALQKIGLLPAAFHLERAHPGIHFVPIELDYPEKLLKGKRIIEAVPLGHFESAVF